MEHLKYLGTGLGMLATMTFCAAVLIGTLLLLINYATVSIPLLILFMCYCAGRELYGKGY